MIFHQPIISLHLGTNIHILIYVYSNLFIHHFSPDVKRFDIQMVKEVLIHSTSLRLCLRSFLTDDFFIIFIFQIILSACR